jgi:hypothetical protein
MVSSSAPSPPLADVLTETVPAQHIELLTEFAVRLLEDPAGADPKSIRCCLRASGGSDPSPDADHLRLAVVLAALYARPELIDQDTVLAVTDVFSRIPITDDTALLAGHVLGLLTCFDIPTATDSLLALLQRPTLSAPVLESLVRALGDAMPWVVGRLNISVLVDLAAQPHLSAWRDELFRRVVEPTLFVSSNELERRELDQLVDTYADSPDITTCLSYLSGRSQIGPDVRDRLAVRDVTPLAERVRAHLSTGRRRGLIVQNIMDRQGDELVRVVPLVQALLDVNSELEITLVTARAYLYAHPRITLISIEDRAAVRAILGQPFDVVAEFFEPKVLACNHDVMLRPAVAAHLQEQEPFIDLSADKGYNRFVFSRLNVEGRSRLDELALDRQRVLNVYETTFRLISCLGLPLRLGEERPVSEPVIAGIRSPEAEAAWRDVTRGNVGALPVALINPFGGAERLKGYVESNLDELADRIRETISEGFFVVLLPNGTPWGTRALALKVVGMLRPEERRMVSVGPDLAIQLVMHFIRFADRVISVEGWTIHAAYVLGKPFRILMLPYSYLTGWLPYGRTGDQTLVRPVASPARSAGGRPLPPLPSQPRKLVLLTLLEVLKAVPHPRVPDMLRWALSSEDHDIRCMATSGLSRQSDSAASADLYRLLDDSSCVVRAEAAVALLERLHDETPGGHWSREQLLAYRWIGEKPPRWANVMALGDAARPALLKSLHDDDETVHRDASHVLALLRGVDQSPLQSRKHPGWRHLPTLFHRGQR